MKELIQFLKSMCDSITISKSGKGFNLNGLNPDTFDLDAISDLLQSQSIVMEAVHFPEETSYHPKTGEKSHSSESVYVGPPTQLPSSSDDELESLMVTYKG